MDTQNVLTNQDHICSNICMTMGLHDMHVSIALACIFKMILINTI